MLERCIRQLKAEDPDFFVIPPPAMAPIATMYPRTHLFVKEMTRHAKNT